MLVVVFAALLLSQRDVAPVAQFRTMATADVPAAVFDTPGGLCDGYEPHECRRRFIRGGGAWAGDLNADGVGELLLAGSELAGNGGSQFFLFGQRGNSWQPLTPNDGWITMTAVPRFDILPTLRGGYHDIRVSATACFKWNGSAYVVFDAVDVHALQARWFNASTLEEADLFWAIRYRGKQSSTFDPQWFPSLPAWSRLHELDDPMLKLRWVAMFKGGVYGVEDGRSFLLLPAPLDGRLERLAFEGDWLVISADVLSGRVNRTFQVREVARYNRRTRELRVTSDEP